MWPPRTQGPRLPGRPRPRAAEPAPSGAAPSTVAAAQGTRASSCARPPAGPRPAPFPGPLANPAGSTQSLRRRQRCARHKTDSLGTRTRLLRYRLFILTVKDSRAGRRAPPLPSRPAVGAYSSAKSSCFVTPDGLAFGAGGGGSPSAVAPGPSAADGPHALPSMPPVHQARDALLIFTDRILAFVLFCLCGTGISMEKFSWSWHLNFAFFSKFPSPRLPMLHQKRWISAGLRVCLFGSGPLCRAMRPTGAGTPSALFMAESAVLSCVAS